MLFNVHMILTVQNSVYFETLELICKVLDINIFAPH